MCVYTLLLKWNLKKTLFIFERKAPLTCEDSQRMYGTEVTAVQNF